ncbi:MAG: hypothetical protein Q4B58_08940, partial [Bacteroidales bacterium]|nr:hypothetical protein [Bacteroidales bacterium]
IPMECILRAHRVQAFRSGTASFRFAPFRSASAAYLPTHIQSPRGLRRLSATYLPKATSRILTAPMKYPLNPELDVSEYINIQTILDSYDDIKDLSDGGNLKIAFVKNLDKGYAVVAELSKENDKIVLHKTFFYRDSAGRRVPYRNKPSILEKWSEDGSTSISPTETQQPADTEDISALDQSSEEKSVSASSSDIETEPEGKRNGTATPQNGISSDGKSSKKTSNKQNKSQEVVENKIEKSNEVDSEDNSVGETTPLQSNSYTIEPAEYTNKRGKTTQMHLVKFRSELTKLMCRSTNIKA